MFTMSTDARLSTCGICGGTIQHRPTAVSGWGHIVDTPRNADGHRPDPDDSAVSGPDRCEWCDQPEDDCDAECDCPECEAQRALDEQADMYHDNAKD